MENRRKSQRRRVRMLGRLIAHGRLLTVSMENLSAGGVRIVLDMPLMEGAEVEISLSAVRRTDEPALAEPIDTRGTVAWCTEDMDVGFQAGIRFDSMAVGEKERLAEFLESLTAS